MVGQYFCIWIVRVVLKGIMMVGVTVMTIPEEEVVVVMLEVMEQVMVP